MKRFWIFFALLSLLILTIFGIWGARFEDLFDPEYTAELLNAASFAAGPLGVVLLASDIILPIPTTVVIGAMGAVLGTASGAFWGWVGLTLAGWTGYGLAKLGGTAWKSRLVTPEEEARFGSLFDHHGGLAVVISRMLPILPEVLSILAGLYGMKPARFGVAVTLGSLPPALLFSWIGSTAREAPLLAVLLLTGFTGAIWLGYLSWISRIENKEKD